MPQTKAEIISNKVKDEIKRLAPHAIVRVSFEGHGEDGADIYIYAPRKHTDMLASRAKKLRDSMIKGEKFLTIRILPEDIESMSEEAKKKYGIPTG